MWAINKCHLTTCDGCELNITRPRRASSKRPSRPKPKGNGQPTRTRRSLANGRTVEGADHLTTFVCNGRPGSRFLVLMGPCRFGTARAGSRPIHPFKNLSTKCPFCLRGCIRALAKAQRGRVCVWFIIIIIIIIIIINARMHRNMHRNKKEEGSNLHMNDGLRRSRSKFRRDWEVTSMSRERLHIAFSVVSRRDAASCCA